MNRRMLTKSIAAVLGSVLLLSSAGLSVFVPFVQQTEAAAAVAVAKPTPAFSLFEQRVKKPSPLSLAQATLINRIDEMTPAEANVAVLHLENALKAYLPTAIKRMNTPSIQKDIKSIYTPGMPMVLARSKVKQSGTRVVLQDLTAMDYKLETDGSRFYPVIQYKSFKVFKPYISKDLQAYVDLMAAESETPSAVNGTLRINWYQVVERAMQYEAFLKNYKNSNRTAAITEAFKTARFYVFNGTPNTPLFDRETKLMSEAAAIAYENTLSEAGPEQIEASALLTQLDEFLVLLEKNGDKKTQAVTDFLKANDLVVDTALVLTQYDVAALKKQIPTTFEPASILTYGADMEPVITYDTRASGDAVDAGRRGSSQTQIPDDNGRTAEDDFFQAVADSVKDRPVIDFGFDLPEPSPGTVVIYGSDGYINRIFVDDNISLPK